MKDVKYLVDTTLRDGEQSPGYALTKKQKVEIAAMLDAAGVYQIEAGIPAICSYERDTLCEIAQNKRNAKISVWNRLNETDIKQSFACNPDIIHIGVPVSYVQIYTKLHKNKTWIMNTMISCVDLALQKGYEVTVGFEDASRADPTFMLTLASALKAMGVNRIRFADTVGVLSPTRTYHAIHELISITGIEVEMHAHNDLGMAVANSLAAAKAGAKYIDTTILGIGERTGNCNFKNFISASEFAFTVSPTHSSATKVEQMAEKILVKDRKGGHYEKQI
jgi:homocitrate synthase NifV